MSKIKIIREKQPLLVWIDEETNQITNAQGYRPYFTKTKLETLLSAVIETLSIYQSESLTDEIIEDMNEEHVKKILGK